MSRIDVLRRRARLRRYNDAGSMVSRNAGGSVTEYTYDFGQQLVRVVEPTGRTHTYSLDAFGRRLRTVDSFNLQTETVRYAYGGEAVLFTRSTTSVPGMGVRFGESASSGQSTDTVYAYLNGELLFRKTTDESIRFYHYDLSGNVRLVTYYAGGTQVDRAYRYLPFGDRVDLATGPGADPRFSFAGQERDASGLYHMGARYHDGAVGRFTSRDPIGSGYSYGANNPLSFSDPSGLAPVFRTPYRSNYHFAPNLEVVNCRAGSACESIQASLVAFAGQVADLLEPVINPLRDVWNALPEWVQTTLTVVAVAVLTVVTFGAGATLVAVGMLIAGVATGLSFAISAAATGETDPMAILEAFLGGYMLASGIIGGVAILGILAVRAIAFVGRALASIAERGAMLMAGGAWAWAPIFRVPGTGGAVRIAKHVFDEAETLGIHAKHVRGIVSELLRKGKSLGISKGNRVLSMDIHAMRSIGGDLARDLRSAGWQSLQIAFDESTNTAVTMYSSRLVTAHIQRWG